jgi:hypothetical protein
VAFSLCDLFSCDCVVNRRPFSHHAEVFLNLQKLLQRQGPGLADCLLDGQDTDIMVTDPQMVALGFNVRVCNLVVEELRTLGKALDPPVVVI